MTTTEKIDRPSFPSMLLDAGAALMLVSSAAGDPRTDDAVFRAGEDGYHTFRIPALIEAAGVKNCDACFGTNAFATLRLGAQWQRSLTKSATR